MAATVLGTHGSGDHASRPAANTVPDGSLYSCSTHSLIYLSNYAGNSWSTWATLGTSGASSDPAWTTYTPTWTGASSNPAIVNGTLTGAYLISGKTYRFRIHMLAGSSTTFGSGRWDFGLGGSVTTIAQVQTVSCYMHDSSAVVSRGVAGWIPASSGVVRPVGHDGSINGISSTVPWTWATSDQVHITGTIEIA